VEIRRIVDGEENHARLSRILGGVLSCDSIVRSAKVCVLNIYIYIYIYIYCGPGSSVGIATDYGLVLNNYINSLYGHCHYIRRLKRIKDNGHHKFFSNRPVYRTMRVLSCVFRFV